SIPDLVDGLQHSDFYRGQVIPAASKVLPSAAAQYEQLESKIDSQIWDALKKVRGVRQLYSHQAQSIDMVMQGNDVVASTATASGKSVIYQVPILQMLIDDPTSKALLVFPTKALAQDQLGALQDLVFSVPKLDGLTVSVFDGDTAGGRQGQRQKIRESASVILTNPDTLHMAMLPNTAGWRAFWARLRIVVVDELHVYNGQFGQNVAHILTRLRRVCDWAKESQSAAAAAAGPLQFVACSATASNPAEHMQQLTGKTDIRVIDADGSPHGQMRMVLWDALAGSTKQRQGSEFSDVARIAAALLSHGARTIVFCRYRQTCELVVREIVDYLETSPALRRLIPMVMSYRAGYTKEERRQIEQAMFSGSTRMVVATSALELGIDVGSLDAVVMVGVPPNKTNLWQQAGRAGRRGKESLALVIATGNIVDRQVVCKPAELFTREFPQATVTAETSVSVAHLQCAAFELPIDPERDAWFLQTLLVDSAALKEHLVWDPVMGRWLAALGYKPWPAEKVPIRSIRQADWQVIETGARGLVLLEEIDSMRALFTLYEGGIFLHRGRTYEIDKVDPESRVGLVKYANVSWFTEQRDYSDVIPATAKRSDSSGKVVYGGVEVRATVFGYKRIDSRSKKVVEMVERASPVISTQSLGIWVDVPLSVAGMLTQNKCDVEASVHGAQHVLLACLAECVGCMPQDLCTECK
ncbi:P-loop containing nucleoside triphosphate hydrolase protein, partial [Martensiomyces pterosporus]